MACEQSNLPTKAFVRVEGEQRLDQELDDLFSSSSSHYLLLLVHLLVVDNNNIELHESIEHAVERVCTMHTDHYPSLLLNFVWKERLPAEGKIFERWNWNESESQCVVGH